MNRKRILFLWWIHSNDTNSTTLLKLELKAILFCDILEEVPVIIWKKKIFESFVFFYSIVYSLFTFGYTYYWSLMSYWLIWIHESIFFVCMSLFLSYLVLLSFTPLLYLLYQNKSYIELTLYLFSITPIIRLSTVSFLSSPIRQAVMIQQSTVFYKDKIFT